MNPDEYITPKYETITAEEKRKLLEMMNSSLIHAFTREDYYAMLAVLWRVVDRLEEQG